MIFGFIFDISQRTTISEKVIWVLSDTYFLFVWIQGKDIVGIGFSF